MRAFYCLKNTNSPRFPHPSQLLLPNYRYNADHWQLSHTRFEIMAALVARLHTGFLFSERN